MFRIKCGAPNDAVPSNFATFQISHFGPRLTNSYFTAHRITNSSVVNESSYLHNYKTTIAFLVFDDNFQH